MKSKRKCALIISVMAVLILATTWIAWSNTLLMTQELTVANETLPSNFSGYRIAQVSDLHNYEFGNKNQKLLDLLSDSKSDIIVITGDLIDSTHTDIDVALDFAKKVAGIAPVYYVTGNHEAKTIDYEQLETGLIEHGVTVLRNEMAKIMIGTHAISLVGIDDPSFAEVGWSDNTELAITENTINKLIVNAEEYTVLLSHRPELFDASVSNKVDLTFSGHAHGGQFRIPFVGGLIAPNQGLFPKYDSGLYTEEDSTMIVSRGLGNSIIPFRINNRPEIVVVTLMKS